MYAQVLHECKQVTERPLVLADMDKPVANNTRANGREFIAEAVQANIQTHTETFSLANANDALLALKQDAIKGAGVLVMDY